VSKTSDRPSCRVDDRLKTAEYKLFGRPDRVAFTVTTITTICVNDDDDDVLYCFVVVGGAWWLF